MRSRVPTSEIKKRDEAAGSSGMAALGQKILDTGARRDVRPLVDRN